MTYFEVPGRPQGKARPRFSRGHTYTPRPTLDYEEKIARYYKLNGGKMYPEGQPLTIKMLIKFPIPSGTPKLKAQQMLQGHIRPTKRPDGDNVEKAVLDALNGVAYKDDSQVIGVSWEKKYTEKGSEGLYIAIHEDNV